MIHLDLTPGEREVLTAFLERAISELSAEMAGTDRRCDRTEIESRKALLAKLLDSMGETRQMA